MDPAGPMATGECRQGVTNGPVIPCTVKQWLKLGEAGSKVGGRQDNRTARGFSGKRTVLSFITMKLGQDQIESTLAKKKRYTKCRLRLRAGGGGTSVKGNSRDGTLTRKDK